MATVILLLAASFITYANGQTWGTFHAVLQRPGTPDLPHFNAEAKLVNVLFSVRNRDGALIANLGRDDFRIFEDHVPQPIRYFSRDQDAALAIGILLDCSGSQAGFNDENLRIAVAFLKRILRPQQDRAFIVGFGSLVQLACPLTGSFERLADTLGLFPDALLQGRFDSRQQHPGGNSAVLDAIYLSATSQFSGVSARKVLIMIGDGKENASHTTLSNTIERLQALDVLFYGMDNGGRYHSSSGNLMPRVAEETGGREFKVAAGITGQSRLQHAFELIEEELRTMYSIGYVSTNPRNDGKFRHITIRPVKPGFLIRARRGYYAPLDQPTPRQ